MPARQSGLQRDVLKLCRDLFRAARKKDPGNEHKFTDFGKQLCEECRYIHTNEVNRVILYRHLDILRFCL